MSLTERVQDISNPGGQIQAPSLQSVLSAAELNKRPSRAPDYVAEGITSRNPGAELIFGYAAEEVIGKPASILIPADHPDEEPEVLERIRRGAASYQG